jgi:hypothetical protein
MYAPVAKTGSKQAQELQARNSSHFPNNTDTLANRPSRATEKLSKNSQLVEDRLPSMAQNRQISPPIKYACGKRYIQLTSL